MLEPETVEIDGMRFQLVPMPLIEACRWDRRTLRLIAPVLGALDGVDLVSKPADASEVEATKDPDEIVDLDAAVETPEEGAVAKPAGVAGDDVSVKSFAAIASAIGTALQTLSDAEQLQYIRCMLKNVTFLGAEGTEQRDQLLDSEIAINRALTGSSPLTVYLLIFHVARYNKFTPFALAAAGAKHAALNAVAKRVAQGIFSKVSDL